MSNFTPCFYEWECMKRHEDGEEHGGGDDASSISDSLGIDLVEESD